MTLQFVVRLWSSVAYDGKKIAVECMVILWGKGARACIIVERHARYKSNRSCVQKEEHDCLPSSLTRGTVS